MQFSECLNEEELEFLNTKSSSRKRVVKSFAKSLRRRSLSESMSENTFQFEQIAHGIKCKSEKIVRKKPFFYFIFVCVPYNVNY